MQNLLDEAIRYALPYVLEGKPASYIPELGKVDPKQLGVAIVSMEGSHWGSGAYNSSFTMQSISKVAALMLAVMDRGEQYVFSKVGMEPTGDPFNSIIKLETMKTAKPLNPMINAGAIAVDSLILGEHVEDKLNRLIGFVRRLCHNEKIWFNQEVYQSENATGYRNRALANFMKDAAIIEGEVEAVLELYFKQCSIELNAMDIAMMGAVLAGDGTSPITGEVIIPKSIARLVKTFMVTCGMYDASGEFAVRVGLPAKSGVGGGILAAVPGKMGIGVFGPALDSKGNSAGGIKVLEYISWKMDLSIF
ncbi:MAG: glsA [Clostridia bacterium]|jgi:glutaminase|nr:glsA [Clostridia bacterium]